MARHLRVWALCSVLAGGPLLLACQDAATTPACGGAAEYAVTYGGSANGDGYVKLDPSAAEEGSYNVLLGLLGPSFNGAEPELIMQLAGHGRCKDGRLDAIFGAASAEHGRFKILGGTFSAILRDGGLDGPLGRWSATAYDTVEDRNVSLSGLWGAKSTQDSASTINVP